MDIDQLKIQDEQLRQLSQDFSYPPTPNIAAAIAQHMSEEDRYKRYGRPRLAWAMGIILLLAVLMAVPSVRAQVLEFLHIGAIRIFLTDPSPSITPDQRQFLVLTGELGSQMIVTATPLYTPASYPSIEDLVGETTLDKLRKELRFPIQLPSYPLDLGQPDRIFQQDFGGQAVLLVWMEPERPETIRMNLLILGPGTYVQKGAPAVIEETSVNGQRAIWTEGSHFLHLGGNLYQSVPLVVEGNILIWEQDGITYRLECDLSLKDAVKVAESLE